MNLGVIDRIFDKNLRENNFTGGVCCVSYKGKKVFHRAYGYLNKDKKENTTLNTIFDLASITKIITTTIVLKMITENKLSLNMTVRECLPKVKKDMLLAPITIKQLLTHTSGLKSWYPLYTHENPMDFLDILKDIKLNKSNSKKVEYSDLNFMLLGEIIKKYYTKNLQDILLEEIVNPLNLKTITYNPVSFLDIAATEFGNRIEKEMCRKRGHIFRNWRRENSPIKGEVNDGNSFYYWKGQAGHAGLFSNVEDLIAIGELYLRGGRCGVKQLISNDLIKEALTILEIDRGLGWEASDIYPSGFGHTGFTGTALWIDPEKGIAVGLLTNRLNVENPKNINPFRKEVFGEISKEIDKLKGVL